jgi:ElaB/YqjD/DUF883 family membrane-anchored ribosome-binding protein
LRTFLWPVSRSQFEKKLEQEISEVQDQQDKVLKENHQTLTETLKQTREKFSKEVVCLFIIMRL